VKENPHFCVIIYLAAFPGLFGRLAFVEGNIDENVSQQILYLGVLHIMGLVYD